MARIEFEAFVEDVLTGQSGAFGLKTAEPHSRKDENGKWQTVARTFRSVKASRESGIDFAEFAKGDRVKIWGSEKTEVREYEGKKFYDLVVWADRVERAERGQETTTAHPASAQPADDPWATAPIPEPSYGHDEVPF